MRNVLRPAFLMLWIIGGTIGRGHAAPPPSDQYLTGYLTAVLRLRYHVHPLRLTVHHGVVKLTLPSMPPQEAARIKKSLLAVPGIRAVGIRTIHSIPGPPVAASALHPLPSPTAGQPETRNRKQQTLPFLPPLPRQYRLTFSPPAWKRHGPLYRLPTGFFPPGRLFTPLLADPKWPGSSAAYAHYSPYHPNGLKDVVAVSIGDTIPFFRDNLPGGWQEEGGMQADVYAYFNMDTTHKDLQNADYFVGGYAAFRHRNLSFIVRFFHQSSHLGDEFLINNPAYYANSSGIPGTGLRTKISYEQINSIVSLDLWRRTFRVYGGGGYLVDVGPSTLGKWTFEYGAEYHGPVLWRTPYTRWNPVAGADFQNWSYNHYDTDISLRAGIQATNGRPDSPRLQFLLEFYTGHSYYGQFFVNPIQYFGLGVHFYF